MSVVVDTLRVKGNSCGVSLNCCGGLGKVCVCNCKPPARMAEGGGGGGSRAEEDDDSV